MPNAIGTATLAIAWAFLAILAEIAVVIMVLIGSVFSRV
jgi:hypothetical protein